MTALLEVRGLRKTYYAAGWRRPATFSLLADFSIERPAIVGVLGPNGSGKTTLFELITGSNRPTSGTVLCAGKNMHRVRYDERDRLAIHHHQSYQIRHFRRTWPNFMLERAGTTYPLLHLFDEPEFSPQDGYIGFMLGFFRRLRAEQRLVLVSLHPHESYHIDILRQICERFIFIDNGRLFDARDWPALIAHQPVRGYLGALADYASGASAAAL
jgi:ABC-type multidrug transport system ATPase subunit